MKTRRFVITPTKGAVVSVVGSLADLAKKLKEYRVSHNPVTQLTIHPVTPIHP